MDDLRVLRQAMIYELRGIPWCRDEGFLASTSDEGRWNMFPFAAFYSWDISESKICQVLDTGLWLSACPGDMWPDPSGLLRWSLLKSGICIIQRECWRNIRPYFRRLRKLKRSSVKV